MQRIADAAKELMPRIAARIEGLDAQDDRTIDELRDALDDLAEYDHELRRMRE